MLRVLTIKQRKSCVEDRFHDEEGWTVAGDMIAAK